MADKPEELDDDIQPPKRSPLVLILIITNVVVIGAAVAAFFIFGGSGGGGDGEANTNSGGSKNADPEEETADYAGNEPGPMVDMPPFVVNLSDTERAHYLKVAISLELRDEEASKRYEPRKTHARHAILMTLSSLSIEETRDIDDRERIRDRLQDDLEKVLGSRTVRNVLFTDFVTQ